MNNKYIGGFIVALLIVGGGSFYGGMQYGKNSVPPNQSRGGQQFGGGARRGMGGRAGGQFISGEILNKDDKSVTIKLQDGGSKIVFLSSSTTIGKATNGSLSDLTTGAFISVGGSQNNDGSVTAQTIQIRPAPPAISPNQPRINQ